MTNRLGRRRKHKIHKSRTKTVKTLKRYCIRNSLNISIDLREVVRKFKYRDLRGLRYLLSQKLTPPEWSVAS